MIKTKEFIILKALDKGESSGEEVTLEEDINGFIKDNNITELIDIKYSKTIEFDKYNRLYLLTSALIIYK